MLKIKKVSVEDKDILLEWRNDPRIYKHALNPFPVAPEDHEKWFQKIINNKSCFFYMGWFDGQRCGTVRYHLLENENEAEVSISLAPKFHGKGLGFELMKLAESQLKLDSQVKLIHATVLNENAASMSLFLKSKFKPHTTLFKKEI